jgi:UDP-N-acetylmuramoyl-L-alanyl-D-glutamate--2,6-diaminopimelate ligase
MIAGKRPVAAINFSDPFGQKLIEILARLPASEMPKCIQFGSEEELDCRVDGVFGSIQDVAIQSSLVGRFNAFNISAAVGLAKGIGIPSKSIEVGVSKLSGVPGRLERVVNSKGVHIWVDYAHKPDALEKVIKTLRDMRQGKKLITVFGCGGDRDRKKRPLMGQIAVQWSDQVWITSDNPRTEEPMAIIQEIVSGVGKAQNFTVQVDRRKAIFEAVSSAMIGDLVLIAGKGHEDYQLIGTQKLHFDDREVAFEAIRC